MIDREKGEDPALCRRFGCMSKPGTSGLCPYHAAASGELPDVPAVERAKHVDHELEQLDSRSVVSLALAQPAEFNGMPAIVLRLTPQEGKRIVLVMHVGVAKTLVAAMVGAFAEMAVKAWSRTAGSLGARSDRGAP